MKDIEEAKNRLVVRLSELGIREVRVEYSGGGDSGQIDYVSFHGFGSPQSSSKRKPKLVDLTEACKGETIRWHEETRSWDEKAPRLDTQGNQMVDKEGKKQLGAWVTTDKESDASLSQACEDLCLAGLEADGSDWYNNEGGQGSLVIDVSNEVFTLNIGINETTTHETVVEL